MVLGVGHLEGSCTYYAKHSIAVHARSSIVKGISDRVEKYFLTILVPKCYNIVTVICYHTEMRNRRETKENRMKYFIAALCLVFAGAAYGKEEQAVVVRDKNNKFYLVTYDCGTPAVRAWLRGAAQVGDVIRIRDKRDRTRLCTITAVKAFA